MTPPFVLLIGMSNVCRLNSFLNFSERSKSRRTGATSRMSSGLLWQRISLVCSHRPPGRAMAAAWLAKIGRATAYGLATAPTQSDSSVRYNATDRLLAVGCDTDLIIVFFSLFPLSPAGNGSQEQRQPIKVSSDAALISEGQALILVCGDGGRTVAARQRRKTCCQVCFSCIRIRITRMPIGRFAKWG